MPQTLKNKPFLLLFMGAFIAVMPLIGSAVFTYLLLENQTYFSNTNFFFLIFWAIIWAFLAASACVNPTLLAVLYGYIIGIPAVIMLIFINLAAVLFIYIYSKKWGQNLFSYLISKNLKAQNLISKIKKDEWKIIFFTKLSPILPFTLTNICFVSSGAKLRNIILGGVLGMIPRTALAVFTGMQSKNFAEIFKGNRKMDSEQYVLVALLLISIIGLVFLLRNKTKTLS